MSIDSQGGYRFYYDAIVASAAEPDSRPITLKTARELCREIGLSKVSDDDIVCWATHGLEGHVLSTASDGRQLLTTARALYNFWSGVSAE